MSTIGPKTTRAELAAIVSEALHQSRIDALLVGGSVVSLFASERYVTHDLDFVSDAALKDVQRALEPLGFSFLGRLASHPGTSFILDFVAPPPAVGSKPITQSQAHRTPSGSFQTLTPTDCVLDRLAAFYFWDDVQGLEQAVMVAAEQPVDLAEIKRWTRAEGAAVGDEKRFKPKLQRFLDRVAKP